MAALYSSGLISPIPFSFEPTTIRIGVTGHRTLQNPDRICASVFRILTTLDERLAGTPHHYQVISALADGADRLVAHAVLGWKVQHQPTSDSLNPTLELVLPMPEEIYYGTFQNKSPVTSAEEFRALAARASRQTLVPPPTEASGMPPAEIYRDKRYRDLAYKRAGELVVENCDILISVWDGKPAAGIGGTADAVNHARARGTSLVWIHSSTAKINWPGRGDDFLSQLDALAEYNADSRSDASISQEVAKRLSCLVDYATIASFPAQTLAPLQLAILPHFVKASSLAAKNQEAYFRWGIIGYACAAGSVATAAYLSILGHTLSHYWFLLEVFLLLVALGSGYSLKHFRWQHNWIDYRYLAERLRATCFLYAAGVKFEPPPEFPDLLISWLPHGWMTIALRELWRTLPPSNTVSSLSANKAQVQSLARFLFKAWIDHQQTYYEHAARTNHRKNEQLELLSLLILGATVAIALTHSFAREELMKKIFGANGDHWLSMLAVSLPAVVSAVASVIVYMHFRRNAERYESMGHYLKGVGEDLLKAAGLSHDSDREPDLLKIQAIVEDADHAMAHEHEGWRTVFGVRLPGPG